MAHPTPEQVDLLWKALGAVAAMLPPLAAYMRIKVKKMEEQMRHLSVHAVGNTRRLDVLENGGLTKRIEEVLAVRRGEMRQEDAGLPIARKQEIIRGRKRVRLAEAKHGMRDGESER